MLTDRRVHPRSPSPTSPSPTTLRPSPDGNVIGVIEFGTEMGG